MRTAKTPEERFWGPPRAFSGYRTRGLWWFRVFGWGIHWKDNRIHRPLFSERNGYVTALGIGSWRFRVLKRGKRFLR